MSDKERDNSTLVPPPEFAPPGTPMAYADIVTSFSNDQEVARFYFARVDQSAAATGNAKVEYVAQVVMPLSRFVDTVGFFNLMLEKMVKSENTPKEILDRIQKMKYTNGDSNVGIGEPE